MACFGVALIRLHQRVIVIIGRVGQRRRRWTPFVLDKTIVARGCIGRGAIGGGGWLLKVLDIVFSQIRCEHSSRTE